MKLLLCTVSFATLAWAAQVEEVVAARLISAEEFFSEDPVEAVLPTSAPTSQAPIPTSSPTPIANPSPMLPTSAPTSQAPIPTPSSTPIAKPSPRACDLPPVDGGTWLDGTVVDGEPAVLIPLAGYTCTNTEVVCHDGAILMPECTAAIAPEASVGLAEGGRRRTDMGTACDLPPVDGGKWLDGTVVDGEPAVLIPLAGYTCTNTEVVCHDGAILMPECTAAATAPEEGRRLDMETACDLPPVDGGRWLDGTVVDGEPAVLIPLAGYTCTYTEVLCHNGALDTTPSCTAGTTPGAACDLPPMVGGKWEDGTVVHGEPAVLIPLEGYTCTASTVLCHNGALDTTPSCTTATVDLTGR